MSVSHEKIVDLIGTVDGANRNFTTPAPFVTGTIKSIINGVVYESTDDNYGFTEVSSSEIQLNTAPKSWYKLQLFMQEAEMQGSPFHPSEL